LKDGGVLKIIKNKHAGNSRNLFKRKVKRMVKDFESYGINHDEPNITLGNATSFNLEDSTINAIITSPPYINNIDYSKIYGLELSLIYPNFDFKSLRSTMLRSFIGKNPNIKIEEDYLNEVLTNHIGSNPPLIAYTYFKDMFKVVLESNRVLNKNGIFACVVGNSIMEKSHIKADEIIAQFGEDLGMEAEIRVGLYRKTEVQVKGKIPVRESCVILKKI
jgi:tRNA G10  N-methylase Trm11